MYTSNHAGKHVCVTTKIKVKKTNEHRKTIIFLNNPFSCSLHKICNTPQP